MLKGYWNEELGDASTEICDARMPYGCEYLGNGPRIVVRPLTDRIYATATQARHLNRGCAPAGPTGTGKAESTKELRKYIGTFSSATVSLFMAMSARPPSSSARSLVCRSPSPRGRR